MRRSARLTLQVGVAVFGVASILAATVIYLNLRGEDDVFSIPLRQTSDAQPVAMSAQIERGQYLALVGNCAGCHSNAGGAAYAGGRGVPTPFGTIYTSNLTPEKATGIGSWSPANFWRAMHNGRARDGRLLNPVFPYSSYTHVTRDDSDAIYAYLFSLPPVVQPNREHELRFPYNTQAALAVWRALYFRAADPSAEVATDTTRTPQWVRGAYLARGLGHCVECHSARNALGAISGSQEFAGGAIPAQGWYAPSLAAPDEAGVALWKREDVVALLKTGLTPVASVIGPMAEVVYGSTQHWSDQDLQAVAEFLQTLPAAPARKQVAATPAADGVLSQGAKIYERDCGSCHGRAGQGAPGIYPALAGNRAVTMWTTTNLVHIVRSGGFAPATAGNPRPYGMPPFSHTLSDSDIASVLTYIRQSWGNQAAAVSQLDALQQGRGN